MMGVGVMLDANSSSKANRSLVENVREKYYKANYENKAYRNYQVPFKKADAATLQKIKKKAQRDSSMMLIKDVLILTGVIVGFVVWWIWL